MVRGNSEIKLSWKRPACWLVLASHRPLPAVEEKCHQQSYLLSDLATVLDSQTRRVHWYNNGQSVMGVPKCFLVGFDASSHREDHV